jgi:hypothetical protein
VPPFCQKETSNPTNCSCGVVIAVKGRIYGKWSFIRGHGYHSDSTFPELPCVFSSKEAGSGPLSFTN